MCSSNISSNASGSAQNVYDCSILFYFSASVHLLRTDQTAFVTVQLYLTCIFWVGTPMVGPPTSLQYKSYLGLPASSWPQVAVAEILDPSARLKYGGFKLNPVKSLTCPSESPKNATIKITSRARRWAPLIPLAMFHIRHLSRCRVTRSAQVLSSIDLHKSVLWAARVTRKAPPVRSESTTNLQVDVLLSVCCLASCFSSMFANNASFPPSWLNCAPHSGDQVPTAWARW